MRAYERFLNYVPVWTTSDETSDTVPSADRELVLARMLVEEMKGLGIADARAGAQAMVAGMEAARLGGLAAVALQDLPSGSFRADAPRSARIVARKTRNRTWNRVFRAKRRWLPISDALPVCYTEGVSSFRMIP